MIVEVRETATNSFSLLETSTVYNFTDTVNEPGPSIVVRPEEALIVIFVLVLWIGAIGLFFHRWGKIRMLEPYQPKFIQQHRGSCPLVDLDLDLPPVPQRSSLSKMSLGLQSTMTSVCSGGYTGYMRPRQNSVFVGPHVVSPPQPPRKTRSAVDIHSMILSEGESEAV
ncbi:uncharacterized protein LOC129718903 isoform X2 [Wyeomyia smithii]|uniref:uncharacterized protein LOC129718903 isoform X2 n=1 Tax=Wyeomyia smithii TaxID=174621 RepID=UPI002467C064|nr:uncharacterized protein LOC129718903 isoform X2 [Wyeomyia smithii]XP_055526099.1 uncharacterized protein LOC129718903 isoform X2 [Wyeomyia smithii]